MIRVRPVTCVVIVLLGGCGRAAAQGIDFTFFIGRAFPIYDERLALRPSSPTLPGVDITVDGSPLVEADGGPVVGGALAFEWGILGIEDRLDATDVALDLTGARYNLRGGLSYLPDINVTGSLPLSVEVSGIPIQPNFNPRITLRAAPGQSEDRWGVNGGGLRLGGRVALMGEVRVFYFQDYELRFGLENGPEILNELLAGLAPVRFDPVFVNAQAGVTFRF